MAVFILLAGFLENDKQTKDCARFYCNPPHFDTAVTRARANGLFRFLFLRDAR